VYWNCNNEPLPSSLSAQRVPPCFSTNSLHIINPSPLLGSPSVPGRFEIVFSIKRFSRTSLGIPIPVSLTDMVASFSLSFCAINATSCPVPVNLIALETRFLTIVWNILISTKTSIFSGTLYCNFISFEPAVCKRMAILSSIRVLRFFTVGLKG